MVVRISTGEIFIVLTLGELVRPIDFKPPITITITIRLLPIISTLFSGNKIRTKYKIGCSGGIGVRAYSGSGLSALDENYPSSPILLISISPSRDKIK